MIQKAVMTFVLIMHVLLVVDISYAEDSWEMPLNIRLQNAEQKLFIGQRADAADSADRRYDIPAFISGDLNAYILLKGNRYWKDIRQTCAIACKKTWNIIIKSESLGQNISITWDLKNAYDKDIILKDMETGSYVYISSEQGEYVYKNAGLKEFIVEVNIR